MPKALKLDLSKLGPQAKDTKDDEKQEPAALKPEEETKECQEMKDVANKIADEASKEKEEAEKKRDQETLEKYPDLKPLQVKFNEYQFPPLVLKILEGMKVGELSKVTTTRLDKKMRGNFPNEEIGFD